MGYYPKPANAKVVGNNISGAAWGIFVTDTIRGSIAGNTIHDNCAGMFFESNPSQPVGGFEVKANTVENNTRSCRGANFDRNFSGVGIALLGASGMEVAGNHLSGNVPSGPHAQRRLAHVQPPGGPPEVLFFGHRDKVS
ncbi:MAG TPA: right-handed parallel beta-helix repeat-containing protein [Rubrobacter sp.]|nr:right-handed parallel beta-helix repeat-containing protein [Rubrobacter sp.]